ncbi:DnaB-like helicase N-terminal domain-containing protein [Shigella dysenteriae]|nr:DnaB-like helicase N-terminal domain-containing protein [Shigella dysenteriae]MDS1497600.1 DnaB-like helicase N-terminal domain-containing protein [Shigella dysenteriae]
MTDNTFPVPYRVDAEQAVLGGLMVNTDTERAGLVYSMLKPESFYVAAHRVIFREIRGLFRAGKPTDLLSLANVIEAKKLDAETGGFAYLAEISRSATLSAMVHYAGIVHPAVRGGKITCVHRDHESADRHECDRTTWRSSTGHWHDGRVCQNRKNRRSAPGK